MLISKFSDAINKTGYSQKDVEISIKPEDFPEYIKNFYPKNLNLPSEEFCKKAFLKATDATEVNPKKYRFVHSHLAICEFSHLEYLDDLYEIDKDNQFRYICDFSYEKDGRKIFMADYYIHAMVYYFKYLKGKLILPNYAFTADCIPPVEKAELGVLSIKNFIARAYLYKEAFEKMGEKKALAACEKAIKSCEEVFPSAVYCLEVWRDLMTRMNLIKNNLLDL